MDLKTPEVNERELVIRILEGIAGGQYPNPWFLYGGLPKVFRQVFSYKDVLHIFHNLEWHVKVIEIDSVRVTDAYCPWKPLGATFPKKVVRYGIRPQFQRWKYDSEMLDAILANLHNEMPAIDLAPPSG